MKKDNRKEKFLEDEKWLYTKKMYHRGKFDNINIMENTMEAYKAAKQEKAPMELDVQLTSDGQVICMHDTDLKRLFNRERKVREISYKRINKIRTDLQVPLFKDVLNEIDGKVELMIELKTTTYFFNKELVKKVIDLLKDYKGKYVIVSFDPYILHLYKKYNKQAYRGRIGSLKASSYFKELIISKFMFFKLGKPDFLSYDVYNFDKEQLLKYKNKGYKITGWPLKEKEKIKELSEVFDNFIIEKFSAVGK